MRNMSFFLTQEQIRNQTKSVTRRYGWDFLSPDDVVQPIVKAQGLKKGERVEKLGCPIRILSTEWEPIYHITEEEVVKEGFPHLSIPEFQELLLKANKAEWAMSVNRIEFEYTVPL